jgi:hypothetical protein
MRLQGRKNSGKIRKTTEISGNIRKTSGNYINGLHAQESSENCGATLQAPESHRKARKDQNTSRNLLKTAGTSEKLDKAPQSCEKARETPEGSSKLRKARKTPEGSSKLRKARETPEGSSKLRKGHKAPEISSLPRNGQENSRSPHRDLKAPAYPLASRVSSSRCLPCRQTRRKPPEPQEIPAFLPGQPAPVPTTARTTCINYVAFRALRIRLRSPRADMRPAGGPLPG